MSNDIQEDLYKLNAKVDHIMKVVCELFIISKSSELLDSKLDQCIKSLTALNYKVDNMNKSSIPLVPPPIPLLQPPPLPILNTSSSTISNINSSSTNRNELMEELKNKIKDLRID